MFLSYKYRANIKLTGTSINMHTQAQITALKSYEEKKTKKKRKSIVIDLEEGNATSAASSSSSKFVKKDKLCVRGGVGQGVVL